MEAPAVERFARRHEKELRVGGLGSEDSLAGAREFVAETGVRSLPMLWDESGQAWEELGIRSRPTAMLFDRRGRLQKQWHGIFDEREALELAASGRAAS